MKRTWLTVDFDDLRHVPSAQGHPTRSKKPVEAQGLSEGYSHGLERFEAWLQGNEHPVTLFIIADLLHDEAFNRWLERMLAAFGHRLTVGCHGLTHRSWSAWPEDIEGFSSALQQATAMLEQACGASFRFWFRAPAGYIAPWMAGVLASQGYSVDSSVNPSWLVRKKAGKGNSWQDVTRAMQEAHVLERPWATRYSLPVNGPALTLFPLSIVAKGAWKRTPPVLLANEVVKAVEDSENPLNTLYWHVLDHGRNNGTWSPPLPKTAR